MIFDSENSVSLSDSHISKLLKDVTAVELICKETLLIDEMKKKMKDLSIHASTKDPQAVKIPGNLLESAENKLAY